MDNMDIMNIVVQICEILSGIAAVVAIIISISLYIHGLNRERRVLTLKNFSEIRKKYFNTKTLDNKEKLKYLNELEYFAAGINENVYDIEIVKKMSASRLIRQYENWAYDFITLRRNKFGNEKAYYEYEKMIQKLKPTLTRKYQNKIEKKNTMTLHDLIVDEFERTKSLSALIYLIDKGRELEFSLNGKQYFISCDKSQKYVSLWNNKNEQSFESMDELIEKAVISNSTLLSVISDIQIETIL